MSIKLIIQMNKDINHIAIEESILIAARKIFTIKGFKATSMSDIATEANIGRTGLHYYYRTKSLLFEAVIDNFADKLLPNIKLIAEQDSTIIDKLPHIIHAYITLLKDNPDVPLFVVNEMKRDFASLQAAITKDTERISPIFMLYKQYVQEVKDKKICNLPVIDIISTFLGLMLTPFILKETLSTLFINSNDDTYNNFLERKEIEATEIMINFLQPKQTPS